MQAPTDKQDALKSQPRTCRVFLSLQKVDYQASVLDLDQNHTHFIQVDSGAAGDNDADIKHRATLVKHISNLKIESILCCAKGPSLKDNVVGGELVMPVARQILMVIRFELVKDFLLNEYLKRAKGFPAHTIFTSNTKKTTP